MTYKERFVCRFLRRAKYMPEMGLWTRTFGVISCDDDHRSDSCVRKGLAAKWPARFARPVDLKRKGYTLSLPMDV